MVRDAGSRTRILNANIVDDQVHLIVATKIVITIKIRLIVQPYHACTQILHFLNHAIARHLILAFSMHLINFLGF